MRRLTSVTVLAVLLVLFFAVNILAGAMLRSTRLDLTEHKLYTLSDGSRNIARAIDEPIRLRLYFSKTLAEGRAALQSHGRRVRELLEEYVRESSGRIVLEVIDPEPFSEAEDEAVRVGLTPLPISGSDTFYFGLVGTNSTDGTEIIPFVDPNQEQFLEYEVSRMIHALANPQRTIVGVLSSLPLDGAPANPMLGEQPQRPWQIMRELRSLFEVRMLDPTAGKIADDVSVLLIVHPKDFTDGTLYAIDQFVLAGGRAVILVDPNCESDEPPAAMRQNPAAMFEYKRSSSLGPLFTAWGIEFDPARVATDRAHAQTVRYMSGNRQEEGSYVGWLGLDAEAMDADDAITGRLDAINLATAGSLRLREGASLAMTPLLSTSSESMEMEASKFAFIPDVRGLLGEFHSGNAPLVIAARFTGDVPSAFPDGAPAEEEEDADAAKPEVPPAEPGIGHLTESSEPINIFVLADVDALADRFWIQEQRLGPILLGYNKLSDNGDLVLNAVENLSGSEDLIRIRARGRFNRPFELVNDLRRKAEQKYLAEEQTLQETLRETETKINEIQRGRTDQAGGQGELMLTPEQLAEIERFRQERVETRRALRNVRLNLRKDIEHLGTRLKVVNIGLVPVVVAIAAVAMGLYRVTRRKSDRRAVAQT